MTALKFTVSGYDLETGRPYTYYDCFSAHQDAIDLAKSLNGAPKPVVRDCTAVVASVDHTERAARARLMLSAE